VYDKSRGLHINCKHPQRARSINAKPPAEHFLDSVGSDGFGARLNDGNQVRSSRLLDKKLTAAEAAATAAAAAAAVAAA
jgi:hypothetical protein